MRQFKSFLFTQCQHCYDCIPIKSHATDVTEELGIDSPMILIGEEGYQATHLMTPDTCIRRELSLAWNT